MTIFSRTKRPNPTTAWVENFPGLGPVRFIRKPGLKRINLRVTPFHGIMISLPRHVRTGQVSTFIQEKRAWILRALERATDMEEKAEQFIARHPQVTDATIRTFLQRRILDLAKEHGFQVNRLSFRNQKSRWGSCSQHNNISLNKKIYYLPPHLQDYILLHELAHTRQKNHAPVFWQILFDILGEMNTRRSRRALREFEFLLYLPK